MKVDHIMYYAHVVYWCHFWLIFYIIRLSFANYCLRLLSGCSHICIRRSQTCHRWRFAGVWAIDWFMTLQYGFSVHSGVHVCQNPSCYLIHRNRCMPSSAQEGAIILLYLSTRCKTPLNTINNQFQDWCVCCNAECSETSKQLQHCWQQNSCVLKKKRCISWEQIWNIQLFKHLAETPMNETNWQFDFKVILVEVNF